MAAYQILDDNGVGIDAHLDLDGTDVVFASRGGARGDANTRNTAYSEGLRLVLHRLSQARLSIDGAWVDTGRVQHLSLAERSIFGTADRSLSASEQFRLLSTRMKAFGRAGSGPGGNSTKKIRIRIAATLPHTGLREVLRLAATSVDLRSQDRLPAELLSQVTDEHVWKAVQRLLGGDVDHGFGPSTDFDLVVSDGVRLPPKAVFGLAASEALGITVLPRHFSGGIGTMCFRTLEAAGYQIAPKNEEPIGQAIPASPDDRQWSEGNPRLVLHLKKERGVGLSRAKKQSFIREHGRLFCERCELDPVTVYGPEAGGACIEVHHRDVHVEEMAPGHLTKLEDLQCLCANCHRVVHALLKRSVRTVI